MILLKDVTPGVKEFVYDADTGMMAVQLPEAIASLTDQGSSSRTITAKTVFNGSRQYSARNAFNATVLVTSSKFDEYEIAMTEDSEHEIPPINTEFPLSPDRARSLKPFLRFALYGSLADAHVYLNFLDTEATITDPHEVHITKFILLMNVEHIDVVDSRSGEVIFSPKLSQ